LRNPEITCDASTLSFGDKERDNAVSVCHVAQRHRVSANNQEDKLMLKWALICAVIAVVAGILGFAGLAGAAAGVAKFLFFAFLVLFVITLILGIVAGKKVSSTIRRND